ncbi:hypothetical protein [Bradyrhizobium sp. 169]|uniref:hypothetical protein n=1 Tax=Bradyrhizobium sp. 169 TaxID=2782640 RepID=UPI0031F6F71E
MRKRQIRVLGIAFIGERKFRDRERYLRDWASAVVGAIALAYSSHARGGAGRLQELVCS